MQQEPTVLTDLSCDALYQRYTSGIFAYLYKQTASRDDAEDLLVEVFLAAIERNNLVDMKEAECKAWLMSEPKWTLSLLLIQKKGGHTESV